MRAMKPSVCVLVLCSLLGVSSAQQDPGGGADGPSGERVDFERQIAPILVARCIECHGPDEQKGDLRLDARAFAFVDGEQDFWTVIPGEPDDSELLRRLGLPLDDEEVMPNKGEPLTKAQQALFKKWVEQGASWPAEADAWIAAQLAAKVLPKTTFALPEVDARGREAITAATEALRRRGAVVQRVAKDTEALEVNLSLLGGKVTDEDVALLAPLSPVLVWLNAARTAITPASAARIAALTELRRLDVAGTTLDDAAFARFAALEQLEYLNAFGTGLGDDGLVALLGLPKLRSVYAWQSKVTEAGAAKAKATSPELRVDLGRYAAKRLADAERQIAEREQREAPVNEICPVLDEPVDAAIFSIHDGRRVAFCCKKCKAAFDADPAKYVGKLPAKKAADK